MSATLELITDTNELKCCFLMTMSISLPIGMMGLEAECKAERAFSF